MTEGSVFEDINKTFANLLQQDEGVLSQKKTDQDLEKSRDQVALQEYNPLACPPDVSKARKHGKAKRVARFAANQEAQDEFCEDCGLPIKNTLFPLCTPRLELAELGAGFPLFYEYMFFCGVLLAFLFSIVGVYGLVANKKGLLCNYLKDHPEDPCNGGLFIEFSLGNRDSEDSLQISSILNLAFVGIGVILSCYYRKIQTETEHKANMGTNTPSDYAIIVKNIPSTETAQSIKAFFEEKGRENSKTSVKKVIMSYHIASYVYLTRRRKKLLNKKARGTISPEQELELDQIEGKISSFEGELANNASQKFTGIAFVIFDTEEETNEVISKFEWKFFYSTAKFLGWTSLFKEKTLNGVFIELKRAPEPFDVIWENLGYGWWEVAKKRLLTNLASLFIIVCSFGAILGINYVQSHFKDQLSSNRYIITLLSLAVSIVVNIINSILEVFIRMMSKYEKHRTFTSYFISVAKKLSYGEFVNTAIITLIVQIIVSDSNDVKLWTEDGMVPKVYYLYILNAILPSIGYLLDPIYFIQLWKRFRVSSNPSKSKLTQQDANRLFEGPAVDMPLIYANVQKTMLFTGFYANLVPIGIAISLAGLFMTYWIDKYLLLRRHSRPKALGKESIEEMSNFLELFLISFTVGNLIFDRIVRDDVFNLNWIAFIIACTCYVFPKKWLISCFQRNSHHVTNIEKYDDIKYTFISDYDRVNPITQKEAMKDWFDQILKLQEENKNPTIKTNRPVIPFFQRLPPENALKVMLSYSNSKIDYSNFNILNQIPMAQTKQFQLQFLKMMNLNDLNFEKKSSLKNNVRKNPKDINIDFSAILRDVMNPTEEKPSPIKENTLKPSENNSSPTRKIWKPSPRSKNISPCIEETRRPPENNFSPLQEDVWRPPEKYPETIQKRRRVEPPPSLSFTSKPASNNLLSFMPQHNPSSKMLDHSLQPQTQFLQSNQIRINNRSNYQPKSYQSLFSQAYEDQINLS